jgi:hypothetical protein
MAISEPDLARLLQLTRAGRDHPARGLWAGQPVFDHRSVLALLSDNRVEAKRRHRELVSCGLISPTIFTTRDSRTVRVQILFADRIADAMNGGASGSSVPSIPPAFSPRPGETYDADPDGAL